MCLCMRKQQKFGAATEAAVTLYHVYKLCGIFNVSIYYHPGVETSRRPCLLENHVYKKI